MSAELLWRLDKHKRWRSAQYLAWVRTQPCRCRDPRCPLCNRELSARDGVVAAHLRTAHCGAGVKMDDFFTYPLSRTVHDAFHREGQPSEAWQLARICEVMRSAFSDGVLVMGVAALEEVKNFGHVIPF